MLLQVADTFWAVLNVLLILLGAALALVVVVGVPVGVGKLVYDRAVTEDLTNPVAIGFGAAFFAALLGLFAVGTALLYFG